VIRVLGALVVPSSRKENGKADGRVSEEEEVACLQSLFTEKVIIPNEEIEAAREQWEFALVRRFMGTGVEYSNFIARSLGKKRGMTPVSILSSHGPGGLVTSCSGL